VISFRTDLKIMLATQPVDFRKSVHTLSALVSEALRANPYCGDVFIFRSKRSDRVKLLAWDGSGMVLVTKWLEAGRFTWPPICDGVVTVVDADRRFGLDACDPESREASCWSDVRSAHFYWRI
jgi:transposase